jgi:uncharacterized membrane protein (UPF0182 family)
MKKLLLFVVPIIMLAGSSSAILSSEPAAYQSSDQASSSPPTPDQVVAMMSSKLALTDDQKAQITPIVAERQQKMAALKANTSMRKLKKAREAKSIMGDSDKKIEAVLTDDQKTKYAAMEEQMKEKMKEKKDGGQ